MLTGCHHKKARKPHRKPVKKKAPPSKHRTADGKPVHHKPAKTRTAAGKPVPGPNRTAAGKPVPKKHVHHKPAHKKPVHTKPAKHH